MKDDALDLGRVPDPETTQLEDLLEASSQVYHKDVAQFQLRQHTNKMAFYKKLEEWGNAELARGTPPVHVQTAVQCRVDRTKFDLKQELKATLYKLRHDQENRDRAILAYFHREH